MTPLERVNRDLHLRAQTLLLHLLHLRREHDFWLRSRVDTVCLDGDDKVPVRLEEVMSVQRENPRLVRLRNIHEDCVNRADEHPTAVIEHSGDAQANQTDATTNGLLQRMARIFNDRHHIRPPLCHIDKIAT